MEHSNLDYYPNFNEELQEVNEKDKVLTPELRQKISDLIDLKESEREKKIQEQEKEANFKLKVEILFSIFCFSIFYFCMVENTLSFVYWFY